MYCMLLLLLLLLLSGLKLWLITPSTARWTSPWPGADHVKAAAAGSWLAAALRTLSALHAGKSQALEQALTM
jgi:hypothetical protein